MGFRVSFWFPFQLTPKRMLLKTGTHTRARALSKRGAHYFATAYDVDRKDALKFLRLARFFALRGSGGPPKLSVLKTEARMLPREVGTFHQFFFASGRFCFLPRIKLVEVKQLKQGSRKQLRKPG